MLSPYSSNLSVVCLYSCIFLQTPAATWSKVISHRAPRSVPESSDANMWPSLSEHDTGSTTTSASSSRTTSECQSEPTSEHSDLTDLLVEMFPNLELEVIERNVQKNDFDLEKTVVRLLEHEAEGIRSTSVISKTPEQKDSNATVKFRSSQKKNKQRRDRKRSGGHRSSQSEESVDNGEMLSASELKALIVNK